MRTPRDTRTVGIILIVFGAAVLALVGDDVPNRSRLIEVRAGRIADVWSALQNAGHSELTVLIDPARSHSPPVDDHAFYTAFQISVGAKTIRQYAELSESWRLDNRIGAWLDYGTAIPGVVLLSMYVWSRRPRRPLT